MADLAPFIEINRQFDKGTLMNKGSLEFAVSAAEGSKNWQEQLALIVRAIVNDHVFADGNKRTAAAFIMSVFESRKLAYDSYKVDRAVVSIARRRIANTYIIRRMMQNAIR
ncbi:Fic family protein [Candidatus Woesearchaeota archaeon]|nr:Fic family protein [Candidatus Woesearchaeota archaeon]